MPAAGAALSSKACARPMKGLQCTVFGSVDSNLGDEAVAIGAASVLAAMPNARISVATGKRNVLARYEYERIRVSSESPQCLWLGTNRPGSAQLGLHYSRWWHLD